ncbi:hypothetical protein [Mycolicibacter sinensis]
MSGDLDDLIAPLGEVVPPLLRAVHRGCGRTVAVYEHDGGWIRAGARCRCTPAPGLPVGDVLARELARAELGNTRRVKV